MRSRPSSARAASRTCARRRPISDERLTLDPDRIVVPEDGCSTLNADWHNASINYALQNVSTVTTSAAVTEALAGVPAGV